MPAPGKYGRLPRDPSRPVPHFEDYLLAPEAAAPPLPDIPYNENVDYASLVEAWPMYCNGPDPENAVCCPGSPEGCGDCAWAYWGHAVQSWTAYASTEVIIPADEIIAGYATTGYNPQTGEGDNGSDMQTVLEYMRNTGLTDSSGRVHKIAAYALLKNSSQELLAQALDLGGTVYLGASIQQAQEDQFSAGKPWDYVAGSPFVGGHAFGLQRRAAAGLSKLRLVTWGQLWPATTSFYNECVDERYVVISQDSVTAKGTTRAGYNLAGLIADMPKFS